MDSAADQAADAQRALDDLTSAVRRDDAGAAPKRLAHVVTNAAGLGVTNLSMKYVDADLGALTDAESRRYGADAWVATVRAGYRTALDPEATRLDITAIFAPEGDGARLVSFGGHKQRTPLWLLDPVDVGRGAGVAVVNAGPRDATDRYVRMALTARRQVAEVVGDWRLPLVLEIPRDGAQLTELLAADPGTYDAIAAVTTAVDGSRVAGSPVHVFVNPSVFDTLKPRGAQVVLTHEATHVATQAPFASMPLWLMEGFADYVALDHAGVPVDVAAGQILAKIRKSGLPKGLPTEAQLDPSAPGLGATYELAWLACRYFAERFGEAPLISFYRVVDRGTPVADAFARLGTTQAEFVRDWRAELARLAGGPDANS